MARTVAGAAVEGITSGLNTGLRLRGAQVAEEQLARRNAQEDEDRATQAADRARKLEREADDEAMKALEQQQAALLAEGEGLAARYGDAVPEDVGGAYARRKNEVFGARDALLRKRYEPVLKKRQQAMQDLVSRLETGQVNIDDVPDADLYQAFRTATRRDPKDLMSADGKPSRVSQATTDLMTGIQTGNEGMTLAAANVLAEPELKVGVGHDSPRGGKIVGKEIIKLIPHPENPEEFLPVIRVYVKKGDGKSDKPNGATGYYDAPVTENRTGDPDDPVKSISIKKAMDYAAQLQTLSTTLDRPDLRKKLERGAAEAAKDPEDFLAAFYALKGRSTPKLEFKTVPQGSRLVGLDPKGKVVVDIEGADKPATGLAGNVEAVQAYANENGISFEEASALFQKRGLLRAPGKGAGGVGGGGGLDMPGSKGKKGAELLATLSEDDATIVEGLANGTIKPAEISQKGNRREKMVALAKRFDPTADFGPNGKLKDVPAPAQKALLENNTNRERVLRALRLVGGAPPRAGEEGSVDKNATGLKGYIPNKWLNRMDPKGVEARAAIAELGSLIVHDRSGAAVTAAEFPRLAPFIPDEKDDDEAVVKKLKSFARIYQEETDALQGAYSAENGYKTFKVGRGGAEGSWDAPPGAPKPSKPAQPGKPAAQGGTPPPAALKEGAVTTFRNGTRWTLRGGQPVQVQ